MFKCFFGTKHWVGWAYGVGLLLLAGIIAQVRIDVAINAWFGSFYDMIQGGLAKPGSIHLDAYWRTLATFGWLAGVYVILAVVLQFLTKHWVFRWRMAMNDFYVAHWLQLRTVEGASQRVQEDTMRFARLAETLGTNFLRCLLVLMAFLPILTTLSRAVTQLPLMGEVPHALVWVALVFALGGTLLMVVVGRKLPELEFNNQKVEAAFRKELVLGEETPTHGQESVLLGLFRAVRGNYFRLYLHFMYLDLAKWSYLQFGTLLPYIALGPTLVAGGLTLGTMQQIVRAFGKVEGALQYIVNNWADVVELISVYKRLRAFERLIVMPVA